jgi:protein SCO1/2
MIHTENFVLVDKERRIRGIYNGTDKEDMKRLMTDLRVLQATYLN